MSCVYCEPKSRMRTGDGDDPTLARFRSRPIPFTLSSMVSTLPPSPMASRTLSDSRPARTAASSSMPELPPVGEQHRQAEALARCDHLGVAHRAAGLDDRRDAGICCVLAVV